jgi:hypothetical protein
VHCPVCLSIARHSVRSRSNNVSCQSIGHAIGHCKSMVMQLVVVGQCRQLRSGLVNVGLINSINMVMG